MTPSGIEPATFRLVAQCTGGYVLPLITVCWSCTEVTLLFFDVISFTKCNSANTKFPFWSYYYDRAKNDDSCTRQYRHIR